MGGDFGPSVTVPAATQLLGKAELLLCGDQAQIEHELRTIGQPASTSQLKILHAPHGIDMQQGLRKVLRDTRPAALRGALNALAEGRVDAVVSAADTGALMALARHCVGMLAGVDRPAIAKEIIGKHRPFWMADLGANLSCTAAQLTQFARMSALLAQTLSACPEPRLALLNIGTEQGKGPDRLAAAGDMLREQGDLRFVGFIEGSQLFDNQADVIICEGFVGNVTLKAIEGTAAMAAHLLTEQLRSTSGWQRLPLALLAPTLRRIRGSLDTAKYNGAMFLGLQKVVLKSHGAADQVGFEHALLRALEAARQDIPRIITSGLASNAHLRN